MRCRDLGFARRDRGDLAGGQRARGLPVVGGPGWGGRDPPGHDARPRRGGHRRRTRRLHGGAGRPVDRRPRRRGGARGSGAPLRGPARAVAARPRHRLPVRRSTARRGARIRGARGAGLQRTAAAPGAFGARRRRGRDPGPRRRRRPRRVAGAAAAARIATGLGRHRPHRIRGGKPGNGIHLSSVTVSFCSARAQ